MMKPLKYYLQRSGCAYYSNAVFVTPYNKDIIIAPCCNSSPKNILNTKSLRSLKVKNTTNSIIQNWLNFTSENANKINYSKLKDSACKQCKRDEEYWVNDDEASLRLRAKQRFTPTKPGQLNALDISFSNLCNFSCRYCGPVSSSEWNKEIIKAKKKNIFLFELSDEKKLKNASNNVPISETTKREIEVLKNIKNTDISQLQYVLLKGGEPFMVRVLDKFLDDLSKRSNLKNITMSINTNGSVFPKQNILNHFKQLKKLELRISNESIGKLAEYIRNGLDWKKYETIVKKWKTFAKENKNVEVVMHSTLNAWNINQIDQFDKWVTKNKLRVISTMVIGNHLDPRRILTKTQLAIVNKKVSKLKNKDLKISCQTYTNPEKQNLLTNIPDQIKFRKITEGLDKLRNQSLKNVNLELYNWLYPSNS